MGRIACAALAALTLFCAAARAQPAAPVPSRAIAVLRTDPALDRIIAPGTQATLLATGFGFTEGPMWRQGKLWVSDQRQGSLYALDSDGGKTVVSADEGGNVVNPAIDVIQGPNASIPAKDGGVLVMRQGLRDIGHMSPDGKSFTSFLAAWQGKRFNAPNDMVYGRDGTLWFTDPAYSLPGGMNGPNSQIGYQGVFSFKDGKVTAAITDLDHPNGIAISNDHKTLYVSSQTAGPRITAYAINRDGTVSNGHDFYVWTLAPGQRGGIDGMKIDAQGNLWAVGPNGIYIITPDGKALGTIPIAGHATNVAFGGADNKTVFITGGGSVWRLQSLVPGQAAMYAR